MKKKLTLIATAVALGALAVVGATMAYFTSQDTATNVITTGNVQISITETSEDKNSIMNENGIQYIGAITPGQNISKIPVIVNDGNNDAYVRAYVEFKYYDEERNDITAKFTGKEPVIKYNTEDWTKGKTAEDQDFYYYNKAIKANQDKESKEGKTAELFNTVTIPTEWNNDQANVTIEVIVHAEAIQSENNGTDVVAAFKNFAN
ncbi:SipW-dependent-type signal peptide-containing protein [Dysgonomonas gadei]|uniref:SipW-dependent-type signal peptide-containing protein n=1 Tax=Dysgonomonas gadei TaxID=156974 RepID=UPI003AEF7080